MTSSTMSKLVFLLVTLMLTVEQCSSQYHYSNWWHAGGKRNGDLIDDKNLREECGSAVEGLVNQINRFLVKEVLKLTSMCARKADAATLSHFSENQGEENKKLERQLGDKRWK